MEEETRYTKQDLETMRAWTLQRKIQVTQTRLIEWLGRYDWNVYVSFSGGKDSTVLTSKGRTAGRTTASTTAVKSRSGRKNTRPVSFGKRNIPAGP